MTAGEVTPPRLMIDGRDVSGRKKRRAQEADFRERLGGAHERSEGRTWSRKNVARRRPVRMGLYGCLSFDASRRRHDSHIRAEIWLAWWCETLAIDSWLVV